MPRTAFRLLVTIALLLAPSVAFAHPGHGEAGSLLAGFLHPLSGLDHLLAMTAVGLFAAHLGGRALWAVPATFVAVMALGGVSGAAGISLPFVETAIALSVVIFGLMIFSGMAPPVLAAMALVGIFAIFHGHAHGTEMPVSALRGRLWHRLHGRNRIAARLRHHARPGDTLVRRTIEAPRHAGLRCRDWADRDRTRDRSGLIGCATDGIYGFRRPNNSARRSTPAAVERLLATSSAVTGGGVISSASIRCASARA